MEKWTNALFGFLREPRTPLNAGEIRMVRIMSRNPVRKSISDLAYWLPLKEERYLLAEYDFLRGDIRNICGCYGTILVKDGTIMGIAQKILTIVEVRPRGCSLEKLVEQFIQKKSWHEVTHLVADPPPLAISED
jgi:hypothetical protein